MANPNKQIYGPIWKKLKESLENSRKHGICKVAVPVPLQRRVIKGVITAKYKDKAWKFLHNTELRYEISGTQITFTLVSFDGIHNISMDDL